MAWVKRGHSSSFELAGAQALGIDAGLLGDQALDELLVGHFQREDRHVLLVDLGGILGSREHEGGFARAGTPGDQDEIRGLQAPQQAVQVDEAGRHAQILLAPAGRAGRCGRSNRSAPAGWAADRGSCGAR